MSIKTIFLKRLNILSAIAVLNNVKLPAHPQRGASGLKIMKSRIPEKTTNANKVIENTTFFQRLNINSKPSTNSKRISPQTSGVMMLSGKPRNLKVSIV